MRGLPARRRGLVVVGGLLVVVVAVAAGGWLWLAGKPRANNVDAQGVAIKGYDPVAYFTEGRARKGSRDFVHVWDDARWHFVSAANRDRFAADPDRYAPQYGGY